jgi:hypothetical protein
MKRLNRLCSAIQTICPQGSLTLIGISDDPDQNTWKGTISVGCVILAESTGSPEDIVRELTMKLEKMSQRLMRQLTPSNPPEGTDP